jgi:hypothetical protein
VGARSRCRAMVFIEKGHGRRGGQTARKRGGAFTVSCSCPRENDCWRPGPKPTGGTGVSTRAESAMAPNAPMHRWVVEVWATLEMMRG